MKKIFLLEDDFSLNETIKEMLEDSGFIVDTFYNGQKAFDNILADYTLYILDINVPNINGISILEKLKTINPNAKVLIISANINIDQITEAYKKGCDDYLKKPFDIQELKLKIEKYTNTLNIEALGKNIYFDMSRKLLIENQKDIYLTKSEKNLLFLLLDNRGEKISHHQIEEFIYDGVVKSSNAIRTLIKRLRQKLPENLIKNSIDEGYFIEK